MSLLDMADSTGILASLELRASALKEGQSGLYLQALKFVLEYSGDCNVIQTVDRSLDTLEYQAEGDLFAISNPDNHTPRSVFPVSRSRRY
jgi:hypothetical protein